MRPPAGSIWQFHQPSVEVFQKAIACHRQGRLSEAERYYQAVLAADDRHFASVHGLGLIRLQQGRFAEAEPLFRRAVKLDKRSADARHHLAVALTGSGRMREAVRRYEETLSLRPAFAEAHNNLGHALQMLDRHADAVRHYQRALAIDPAYAEAHNNLGNALIALDRTTESIAHYQQAVAIRPDYADAHQNLATALMKLEREEEAIEHFKQTLALAPDHLEAHLGVAGAFAALDRPEEAMAHYQKALAIDPGNANAHSRLGLALVSCGRTQDAVAHYERALALNPTLAEAYNGLGSVLESLGRRDEAIKAFEKAIAVAPRKGAGYYNLVTAKRLTADDPHVAAMRGLADEIGSLGVDDQIALGFALGRVLDQLGDHAQSFCHLIESNRLMLSAHREGLRRAVERERTWLARLRANELPAASDDPRYPISLFVLGPSRSGKTTMERLVGILDGVEPGDEQPVVHVAIKRAFQNADLPARFDFAFLPPQFHSLCRGYYLEELVRRAASARIVTSTNPGRIGDAALIAAALPNVRFICMKRNLEDNILRIFQFKYDRGNFYSYDLKAARDHVTWYHAMMDLLSEKLPDSVRIVHYEDMVADPAGALHIAAELCGLGTPADPVPAVGDDRGCSEPYRQLLAAELFD